MSEYRFRYGDFFTCESSARSAGGAGVTILPATQAGYPPPTRDRIGSSRTETHIMPLGKGIAPWARQLSSWGEA